jgi:hypothetical protein
VSGYAIVDPDDVRDVYAGTDVPGNKIDEFWEASADASQSR